MARRRRDKRRRGAAAPGLATADRGTSRNETQPEGAAPASGQGDSPSPSDSRDTTPAEGAAPGSPRAGTAASPREGAKGRARRAAPGAPQVGATAETPSRAAARWNRAATGESAGRPTEEPRPDPDASRPTAFSHDRSATGRHSSRRRRWLAWVAAATAIAVLYAGATLARRAMYAARLPALPELSAQPPALRQHLEAADRAARDQPTAADAVGGLGLAYHADLFLDEADRAYAAAEALDGDAWRWSYYRALAAGARGDTPGLADGLRRVVAAAPDFGPAWWRLGEAEFKAGRYDAAAEAWRTALPLGEPAPTADPAPSAEPLAAAAARPPRWTPGAPVSAYAAFGLARVSLVQGDANGAVRLLEETTAAAPGFGPAFRLLGDAYATLGRAADAARALRTARRLPQYQAYLDPLAEALVRESRSTTFLLQQAATADLTTNAAWREYLIRRALEFDPDHDVALAELATTFRRLRRYEEALELLERRRRERPDDYGVLADIGRCLSGLGRYEQAEEMLRRALEGLDNAPTRYELGAALAASGRPGEAIAEYRRALDRNPNHLGTLNNLGVALAEQGRMDEAALHLARLVSLDPQNADAHANLGLALAAGGASDRAAGAFREALRLDPGHAEARRGLGDPGLR